MAELGERAVVRRLHERFGFGPRPGELAVGFEATVDRLLGASAGVGGAEPPVLREVAKVAKADRQGRRAAARQRAEDERALTWWWVDRMASVDVPAVERLAWFWHGHFATSEQKVRSPRLMLAQNETFRKLGAGPFAPLAKAMITDPAMLVWLDGNDNRVGSPNENLAREFLELFALGIGHYTEQDVRESARALTGWTVRRDTGDARLATSRRDTGDKQILGRHGDFTAESFVDLVLSRPESARFVVGRLWARLVSATPPDDATTARLVAAHGTDTRSVLRAIAHEPAFHDSATTLVKQPVEWLVGLLRALDVKTSTMDGKTVARLGAGLRGMGQLPFRPPSVGGWAAGGAWLTTAAGLARLDVARLVAGHADLHAVDGIESVGALLGVDTWSDRTAAALRTVAADPAQLVAIAACAPEYVVST
ncbi:DUF1800 domain-containing protein [Actinosynnema sp. NPDC020468]|uniref:DUF1800 domain-containing protein n=1 Tax=Actinosynnema sp. NPDC020468 TaxID=3154488 RepID=UPI0033C1ECFA